MPAQKVTRFEDIEVEKENIAPLRHGRSAHRLVSALSQNDDEIKRIRASFESSLLVKIEDHDDPLVLYLDYIDWINHAFPQGGSSRSSGMLDVIERCITYFKDSERYRDDERYVKIWLWYMELFSDKYKSDCKDLFIFMLRNRIGSKVPLMYEELSSLLYELKEYKYAISVINLGLKECKYGNKLLVDKRQLLLEKLGDDAKVIDDSVEMLDGAERVILGKKQSELREKAKSNKTSDRETKMNSSIYTDSQDPEVHDEPLSCLRNWDIFEILHSRNKENRILAEPLILNELDRPFSGDQLKGGKKMILFQDNLGRSEPVYKLIKNNSGKLEKIDYNTNLLLYEGREICLEEILTMMKSNTQNNKRRREYDDSKNLHIKKQR